MSTVCTCGHSKALFCTFVEGCKFTTEKGALKEPEQKQACTCAKTGRSMGCDTSNGCPLFIGHNQKKAMQAISDKVEEIATISDPETPISERLVKYITGVAGGGCVIELPNGDRFRFRYDSASESIVINKMTDSIRSGALTVTIQPGGGINQILIK